MKNKKILILTTIIILITALLPSCILTQYNENSSISSYTSNNYTSTDEISDNSSSMCINTEGMLEVCFFDVGQGDCMLITSPNGKYILIDSGSTDSKDEVMTFLTEKGVNEIEYAFFTHPHEDHIGAADEIIENIVVKNVYMPDVSTTTQVFNRLLNALEKNKSVNVVQAKAGQKLTLDDIYIEILSPISEKYDEINEYSIIIKITYGNKKFLFTGDAEIPNEKELLENKIDIDADVLKIGHHGSNSSSSIEFLDAVSPKIAVICCGTANRYGHPHKETLEKLLGITTLRTDINGTIYIYCDGTKLFTITSK